MSAAAERVLAEAVKAYRITLDDRLLAAYALGSLAHGGFSPLVSDVDLGLIVADPPRAGDRESIQVTADAEKRSGAPLADRLSVFWGTPSMLRGEWAGGRFPPLDRLDLIENGRLLAGTDERADLPRPSAGELVVTGAEFALASLAGDRPHGGAAAAREGAVEEIRSPELLISHGVRRLTKLALFPARFLFTAETGRVGTNEASVSHYVARDGAPGAPLVASALAWRVVPPVDDHAVAELLGEQLVPLYLHYIDDHITRLRDLGQPELATGFERWRVLLVR